MTELAYRPDQDLLGNAAQERFVFVPEGDRHAREFEIATQPANVVGGDSPEVNAALDDAYAAAQSERGEAAARTQEHVADDAELAQAIDWNAQAIQATRQDVELNGF